MTRLILFLHLKDKSQVALVEGTVGRSAGRAFPEAVPVVIRHRGGPQPLETGYNLSGAQV